MKAAEQTQAPETRGEAQNNHAAYMRIWRKKQRDRRLAAVVARHSHVPRETSGLLPMISAETYRKERA